MAETWNFVTDEEIVNDLELILSDFMTKYYETDSDENKRMLASYYMGMMGGTIMRRGLKK